MNVLKADFLSQSNAVATLVLVGSNTMKMPSSVTTMYMLSCCQ